MSSAWGASVHQTLTPALSQGERGLSTGSYSEAKTPCVSTLRMERNASSPSFTAPTVA